MTRYIWIPELLLHTTMTFGVWPFFDIVYLWGHCIQANILFAGLEIWLNFWTRLLSTSQFARYFLGQIVINVVLYSVTSSGHFSPIYLLVASDMRLHMLWKTNFRLFAFYLFKHDLYCYSWLTKWSLPTLPSMISNWRELWWICRAILFNWLIVFMI